MSGASDSSGFGGGAGYHGKGKGRAVDDENSGSLHDYSHFCVTCNSIVLYPWSCHSCNQDTELQNSGHTDLLTDTSGSGALFSTLDTVDSSNTQDSLIQSGDLYSGTNTFNESSIGEPSHSHWTNAEHQASYEQSQQHQVDDVDMDFDWSQCLTLRQHRTLEFWQQQCELDHRRATEDEIQWVANLTKLSVEFAGAWFAAHQPPQTQDIPSISEEAESQINGQSISVDENVISQVREYAAARAADDDACDNAQSRKASANHKFKCTVGCSFSTEGLDAWKRHLRNRYPQRFWHCILCRGANRKPFITHRKDKMLPHLNTVHPSNGRSKQECEHLRDESEVQHNGQYPTRCPFGTHFSVCNQTFHSWDDFIQHCLDHFEDLVDNGPWQLRPRRRNFEDDDENGSGGPGTSSSSSPTSVWNSLPAVAAGSSANGSYQNNKTSRTQAGPSQARGASIHAQSRTVPHCLIDVKHNRVTTMIQPGVKFLALDYSWAISKCSQTKLLPMASSLIRPSGSLQCAELPPSFTKAIELTRDMGYQYLWIDKICETSGFEERRDAAYQRAALIIVIVGFDSSPDHIWHFTCDYKNRHTVLDWAQNSIPTLAFSHIQNLGQGAYGIVDEVCLLSTRQTYARKTCLSRVHGRIMQPKYLQEIEILQKFDHPHIAKFVAAYVQRRSLNILMLPVADCDLREFLSAPQEWNNKRPFLLQWFFPLAWAVEYMHGLSCRHKDIKPANILISGRDVLLSDFGTSHDFSASDSDSHGPGFMTPKYCAPEVASRLRRGRKSDIFSLGCVFLEMITVDLQQTLRDLKQHLGIESKANDRDAVYHRNVTGIRTWLRRLWSFKPSPYQAKIIEITGHMLDEDPTKRPTAQDVRQALDPGKTISFHQQMRSDDVFYRRRDNMIGKSGFRTSRTRISKPSSQSHSGSRSVVTSAPIQRGAESSSKTVIVSVRRNEPKNGDTLQWSHIPMIFDDSVRYISISYAWIIHAYRGSPKHHDQAIKGLATVDAGTLALPTTSASRMLLVQVQYKTSTMHGYIEDTWAETTISQTSAVIMCVRNGTQRQVDKPKIESIDHTLLPQPHACVTSYLSQHELLDEKMTNTSTSQACNVELRSNGGRLETDEPVRCNSQLRLAVLTQTVILLRAVANDAHANDKAESRDRNQDAILSDNLLQRLRKTFWKQLVKIIPVLAFGRDTQRSGAISAAGLDEYCPWRKVKKLRVQIDRLLASYEHKMLLEVLCQKSRVALILKRRFKALNVYPPEGCSICPQHGHVSEIDSSDCIGTRPTQTQKHGKSTNNATSRNTGPDMFQDAQHYSQMPEVGTPHVYIETNSSCRRNDVIQSLQPKLQSRSHDERIRPEGQSERLSVATTTTRMKAPNGIENPMLSGDEPHENDTDGTRCTMSQPEYEQATEQFPASDNVGVKGWRHSSTPSSSNEGDNYPDHDAQHQFPNYLIEIGDWGLIPLESLYRALARHGRCTCCHGLLPSEADYPFTVCSDSDADSDDPSLRSSCQRWPSIRSVSSSTSLASSATDLDNDPVQPVSTSFDALALTAETSFEVDVFHIAGFRSFDVW